MTSYSRSNDASTAEEEIETLTIDPSDPDMTFAPPTPSALNGGQRTGLQINDFELISGEGESPYMHTSLPIFLSSLSSIKTLRISWHSLDWNLLPDNQRAALIRLITLESLVELEIIASRNFPLGLLRGFSGTRLCLAFTGDLIPNLPTRLLPQAPVGAQALVSLSLMGQRNIVSFMEYFESQPRLRDALRSLRSLCITCPDDGDDEFDSGRNLDLVRSFLRFLDGARIREFRVQDERPGGLFGACDDRVTTNIYILPQGAVIGHSFGVQDLPSLRSVGSIEAHLRVRHIISPHEVYSTLREWLTALLSYLPASTRLRSLDVTYQVIFPQPYTALDGLIDAMGRLWKELDRYLARGFASLRQVNMGFQLHGVGGHERWMVFNAENQPRHLNGRGVDCSFWVRDIYNLE